MTAACLVYIPLFLFRQILSQLNIAWMRAKALALIRILSELLLVLTAGGLYVLGRGALGVELMLVLMGGRPGGDGERVHVGSA